MASLASTGRSPAGVIAAIAMGVAIHQFNFYTALPLIIGVATVIWTGPAHHQRHPIRVMKVDEPHRQSQPSDGNLRRASAPLIACSRRTNLTVRVLS